MAAQRIPFTNKHDAAAQWRADDYNKAKRKDDPAWVDITAEALREQRILEWQDREVVEMQSSQDAARARRLAKASSAQIAQIDAILPADAP